LIGADEWVVDLFAGGGGASTGIESALARPVDLAINHDPTAIAVHRANHPATKHLDADIWEVRPREAVGGRRVGLLWASPDCTHFSIAKGGKPRVQNIRSLAWVVVRWAREVRPRVICVENVSEFKGWGPLSSDGRPDKARMGETFRRWVGRLEHLGYVVEFRILDASLYGAPTRRRRLFIVARRDGEAIRWPEPTHGAGRLPLRTAAQCIDWEFACPSIFERKRPLKPKTMWRIAKGLQRFVLDNPEPFIVRYHGERRVAEGARVESVDDPLPTQTTANRFGLVSPTITPLSAEARADVWPFEILVPEIISGAVNASGVRVSAPSLLKFRGDSSGAGMEDPMPTITAGNGKRPAGAGHALGICIPTIVGVGGRSGQSPATSPEAPMGTITGKGDRAIAVPVLIEMNHANAPKPVDQPLGVVTTQHNRHQLVLSLLQVGHGGDEDRSESIQEPLTTVCASRRSHGLSAALLVQSGYGERPGQDARVLDIEAPLGTVVADGQKHGLVAADLVAAAHLSRDFGHSAGADLDEPTPTVMPGGGGKTALVAAFVAKHFGDAGQRPGLAPDEPLATVTASDHHALTAASLVKLRGECAGADLEEPMPTVTAGGKHIAEVRAFLTAFYGQDATGGQAVDRPARTVTAKARLGLVTVAGVEYQISDIGMRMLQPHELLAAQFGDFAPTYDLSLARTKEAKVKLIGNSVAPDVARALVAAQFQCQEAQEIEEEGVA
jgi:DNA (cytosine-5)-methyltransferase 1